MTTKRIVGIRIEEIQNEIKKIEKRCQERYAANQADRQKISDLKSELRKEALREVIGKPNGVKPRDRYPDCPRNDATGTLLAIHRTRCQIDFGELGKWRYPIDHVALADDEQGVVIPIGGDA